MADYAEDKSCKEVWDWLRFGDEGILVDVRTIKEWQMIGVPDLQAIEKEPLFVEWQSGSDMKVNPDFVAQIEAGLNQLGIDLDEAKNQPVFCLCRSGARSQSAAAALTKAGYRKAINILGGFEGAKDDNGERSNIEGWKFDGLPWKIKQDI